MLYRCFIDDSSDERQQDIVTAGAVIARDSEWRKIGERWKARLRREDLAYFRSTEYYGLRGEFAAYRDPIEYPKPQGSQAAKSLRDDLEKILRDSAVVGIGVAVPLKLYREFRATVPGARDKLGEDAFYSALQSIMIECAHTLRDELPSSRTDSETSGKLLLRRFSIAASDTTQSRQRHRYWCGLWKSRRGISGKWVGIRIRFYPVLSRSVPWKQIPADRYIRQSWCWRTTQSCTWTCAVYGTWRD